MKILLFGSLSEAVGREVQFDLPSQGCSVAELRQLLADSRADLAALTRPTVRACIDQVIAREDFIVRPEHEVAFLPPLSGG